MGIDLSDYVTVPERVSAFYKAHPDGRIVSTPPKVITIGNSTFIEVHTAVYLTPDDPTPSTASAWEPFPGRTPYTKESEMMNAETSAVGRALAAAGIMVSRSLASANEVAARQPAKSGKPTSKSSEALQRPVEALADPLVVDSIVGRLSALRDDIRKEAKEAFVGHFGRPNDLPATKTDEALEFVAEWEMA